MSLQFFELNREIMFGFDQCAHHLSPSIVGYSYDKAVPHLWVGHEDSLDFVRVDLLATCIDATRLSAQHGNAAIFLDAGNIARERIARSFVREKRSGGLL